MNTTDAKRVLETALICAQQPLPLREMAVLFDDALNPDSLRSLLCDLKNDWALKGIELIHVATGWRFQSRSQMRPYLDKLHPEKPPKYSRAVLETLAIIAYRQPVTRGDMEDIRGVTINSLILKQLEERGWVEVIGNRETVGRPGLYATTKQFLDDLGLQSLNELPTMESSHANTGINPGEQLGFESNPSSAIATLLSDLIPGSDEPETDLAPTSNVFSASDNLHTTVENQLSGSQNVSAIPKGIGEML